MDEYKSLNPETGLIEDRDEIREAGIRMSEVLYSLLAEPAFSLLVSPETRMLLAAAAVTNESRMHTLSQAEVVRKLSSVINGPMGALMAEIQIRKYGLSEVLPDTHPGAPRPEKQMDEERKESMDRALQQRAINPFMLDEPYDPFHELGLTTTARTPLDDIRPDKTIETSGYSKPSDPPTPLPQGIEAFLRGLVDDKPEGESDGGDNQQSGE